MNERKFDIGPLKLPIFGRFEPRPPLNLQETSMRHLCVTFALLAVVQCTHTASAQPNSLFIERSPDGKEALARYDGKAEWLAEQKDPRSHLHLVKGLNELILREHRITEPEMRYIASLKQLEHLTIGEAVETVQIDHATFAIVAECTHLKSLNVGKFNWADEDVKAIAKLPNLTDLFLEGPGIDKPTFSDAREDCPEATDGKRLTDAGLRHIARMKSLYFLAVSLPVDLSDEFISELARNSKLEYLYVKSPLFTDKTLETIRTKMDLKSLTIDSPKFSDGAIQKLNDGKKYELLSINGKTLQRSP